LHYRDYCSAAMKGVQMSSIFGRSEPVATGLMSEYQTEDSRKLKALSRWRVATLSQLADFSAIALAEILCYAVNRGTEIRLYDRDLIGSIAVALVSILSFRQGGVYASDIVVDETRAVSSIIIRYSLVFVVMAALSAFTHMETEFSRAWFLEFYAAGVIFLTAERVAFGIALRRLIRRGYTTLSVAIIGMNDLTNQLVGRLAHNRLGIRFVGVFDDLHASVRDSTEVKPKLPNIDDLIDLTHHRPIDLVVISTPLEAAEAIKSTIDKLLPHPLSVRILPGSIGLDHLSPIRLSRSELPGIQLIKIADRPISDVALFMKSKIDKAGAMIGLIAVSPILFFCAAGIAMTSPGPVLFRQRRVGFRGKEFSIIKFRTMEHEFVASYTPTRRGDRRIFPFGQFLRKTSLDELPQLLNVLKGDMSLVGPRPHVPGQMVDGRCFYQSVNQYAGRHRVKPGMTGWAQVNGWRGPAETMEQIEKRIEHDIFYVENWSLLLDVTILIKTVFVCLAGKNAF
jgi:Undecaprenyl-phosphate glucose phosphotransferase